MLKIVADRLGKAPWVILIKLLSFETLLAFIYLSDVFFTNDVHPIFDFNGQLTIPSLLQAFLLYSTGLLVLGLLLSKRRLIRPSTKVLLAILFGLIMFGATDEVFKIHIMFSQVNWKQIYITIIIAMVILGFRDFPRFWHSQPSTVIFVAIGMAIFLLGGFGAEFFKEQVLGPRLDRSHDEFVLAIEKIRVTIEEFGEMVGETLILYGVGLFSFPNNKNSSRDEKIFKRN
jgi:hypothetical protein